MKYLAAFAFAGLVAAQADSLPTCAEDCASSFLINGIGNCSSGDISCICSDNDFIGDIACCLAEPGGCDAADQTSAVEYASQLCAGYGVTVPSAVSCTATSGLASGTGSSTAAAATATTTDASASASATPSTTATATATETAASTKATTTAATTSTAAATTTATASTTAAASSSATVASSSNWAPQHTAALGVIGGLAAALALL